MGSRSEISELRTEISIIKKEIIDIRKSIEVEKTQPYKEKQTLYSKIKGLLKIK